MFRTALLRSARSATRQAAQKSGAIARPASQSSLLSQSRFAPSAFQAVRCYSAAAGLAKPEVEGRIVDLLKNFDKVWTVAVDVWTSDGELALTVLFRSPILRRYECWEMDIPRLDLIFHSSHLLPTSQMILDWTAWIRLRLWWPLRRLVLGRTYGMLQHGPDNVTGI